MGQRAKTKGGGRQPVRGWCSTEPRRAQRPRSLLCFTSPEGVWVTLTALPMSHLIRSPILAHPTN